MSQLVSNAAGAALRLSLVKGVGCCLGRRLFEDFQSYENIWHSSDAQRASHEAIRPNLLNALRQSDAQQAQSVISQCEQASIQILCREDVSYPKALSVTDDAPLVIFVQGNAEVLSAEYLLAMVGARKSSSDSRLLARRWSQFFSESGIVVVSGMAYGIDAASHGGALAGGSATIAVLGGGLLCLQARQQQQVAHIIKHEGCVVSEYLPEQSARAEFFPARNRIIAALSMATLVVEAALRSGSLITARYALTYGRDVFAVPGNVLQAAHAGCHQLIRDGATLIDEPEQLCRLLNWHVSKRVRQDESSCSEQERAVLNALKHDILHLDALSEGCDLTVPELSPILLGLELRGMVDCLPGSRYTLGG
ncbi:MAG: DNA-processing protein DprA [Mariprofundaceae bacterium]